MRTADGGAHWARTAVPPILLRAQTDWNGIVTDFRSASLGWIAAMLTQSGQSGAKIVVYRTSDGGQSWTRTYLGDAPATIAGGSVAALAFVSDARGFLLGVSSGAMGREEKTLFATSDGGAAWQIVSQDGGYIPNPHATPNALPEEGGIRLAFECPTTGWAALGGTRQTPPYVALYRTTDRGANWSQVQVTVPSDLQAKYTVPQAPVFDGAHGTFVTQFGTSDAIITYETQDGGATWQVSSRLPGQLLQASFATPDAGLMFTSGRKEWRTTDGGATWHQVPLSPSVQRFLAEDLSVVALLQMVTPDVGWMVLDNESQGTSVLLKTLDGGKTWQPETVGAPPNRARPR